jgi:chaperone required for assembly of F1-ATPase
MKRFWREVTVAAGADGRALLLDGRPLRTPGGRPLLLPGAALAEAVAGEWRAVEGELRPAAMPLTGLANAATDIVSADPAEFAEGLVRYGESDLTCYRAEGPQPLVARQVAHWEPALKGVEARHGLAFRRTAGVVHVPQPETTLARLHAHLATLSPWVLAPLQPLVTLSGSIVLALAVADGALPWTDAFDAAHVDEDWQAEQWGTDAEAEAARQARRDQFGAAARFLGLAGSCD